MSNTIYDAGFAQYLPEALKKDPKMLALAQSAERELLKLSGVIDNVLIYSRIDELPEELLDILAYDLHCDWYDCKYPVETKRKILKSNVKIHKKLGTKYAVEKALKDVYSEAEVKEWFDYGGQPYCFKITVNVGNTGINENTAKEIEEKMKFYKNLRSHCDGIFYYMNASRANVTAAARMLYGGSIRVKPLLETDISTTANVQVINKLDFGGTLKIKPLLASEIKADTAKAQTLAGISEINEMKVKAKLEDTLKGGTANGTALMYQKTKNTMQVKKKEE